MRNENTFNNSFNNRNLTNKVKNQDQMVRGNDMPDDIKDLMRELPFLIEAQKKNLLKDSLSAQTQSKGLTEKRGRKLKVTTRLESPLRIKTVSGCWSQAITQRLCVNRLTQTDRR